MPPSEYAPRYTATAIVLHWLIAAAVVGLIGWGWWMQTIPKLPVGPRVDAFNLHNSGFRANGDAVYRTQFPPAPPPPRSPLRSAPGPS